MTDAGPWNLTEPQRRQFREAQIAARSAPPPVHYLTRHLRIACQPQRKDLEGAPLNTVEEHLVTCTACLEALAGITERQVT